MVLGMLKRSGGVPGGVRGQGKQSRFSSALHGVQGLGWEGIFDFQAHPVGRRDSEG